MWCSLVLVGLLLAQAKAAQICCPEVNECFNDDPPFEMMPLAECPNTLQISQLLFTRSNPTTGQVLTRNSIPPAYVGSKLTIWLVHGWVGSGNNRWLHDMKDDFLVEGDYNVVVVGWEEGSQQLWYPQSASDTQTVGAEIATTFKHLVASGGSAFSRGYCSGHSLGSHVCGHAGSRTDGLMGRITGMDPAGPMFENKDWSVGLNPTCAQFVDVMHTNGEPGIVLNLGTMKILGDVDFYPNGGGTQPGCILDPWATTNKKVAAGAYPEASQMVDLTPACSHMRVLKYFQTSILNPCFKARYHDCTDRYNLPGSCDFTLNPSQSMGWPAENYPSKGIFYLPISRNEPYCEN